MNQMENIMLYRIMALLSGLLLLSDCTTVLNRSAVSNSNIRISRNPEYTSEIKKISTFPAFILEKQILDDKSDPLVTAYAANFQAKIGEINGNSIEGGDAILSVIGKLKLNDPFQKAIKDLGVNGKNLSIGSATFFGDLSAKTKVDGFALPVISGSYDTLKNGSKITLMIYVYTNKTKSVTLLGEYQGISASSDDIKIANQNNDQGKAKMIALLLTKTSELGEALKIEIQGKPSLEPKSEVAMPIKENPNLPVVQAEVKDDLTNRQKLMTYLYTGAIFLSWFIGF